MCPLNQFDVNAKHEYMFPGAQRREALLKQTCVEGKKAIAGFCKSVRKERFLIYFGCRLTADSTTAILKHRIAGDLHVQVPAAAPRQPGTPLASAVPPDKDALPEELGVSSANYVGRQSSHRRHVWSPAC